MDSTITTTRTLTSALASQGLRYEPLRDINGEILTDLNGDPIMSIIQTYRSILTDDSFVTVTT